MIIYKNDYIRNKLGASSSLSSSSSSVKQTLPTLLPSNRKTNLTEANIKYLRSLNLQLKK